MPIGTVTDKGFSSGGKPKAKIDGKWYFMPEGCNVEEMVGKQIGYKNSQFSINTDKGQKWLDRITDWGYEPNVQSTSPQPIQQALQATATNGSTAPQAAPSAPQKALSTLFDHELRFVSNIVGQAVYCGTIKQPSELKAWFDSAVKCLQGNDPRAKDFAAKILHHVNKGEDNNVKSVWTQAKDLGFADDVLHLLPNAVQDRIGTLTSGLPGADGVVDADDVPW